MEIKKYTSGDFVTNTYVVTINGKSIIIDPTLDFDEIAKDIKSKYNVVGILITHAHIDHIDGLVFFQDKPVYMPRIEYDHINDGGYTLYGYYMLKLPFDVTNLDIHLFDDNDIIDILDEPIKVVSTPGHTLGGVIFVMESERCIFTGDTLFRGSIGRTDFKGGNEEEIFKSIIKIIDTFPEDYKLYPGHGDMTSIMIEKRYNPYYIEAKQRNK